MELLQGEKTAPFTGKKKVVNVLPYEPKATTSCKLTPSINEYRLHEETSLVWNEMQFHFDNLKVWRHGGVVIGSYGFRSQGLHPVIALLLCMKNSLHVVSLNLGEITG